MADGPSPRVLPADAPPPAFGRHEPGAGRAPDGPLIVVTTDGSLDGTLGAAGDDAALAAAAADALLARDLADRRDRRPPAVHRGVPGPAAPRDRGRGGGRPHAGPAREGARLRDGRRSTAARRSRTEARFPRRVDRLVVGWPDEVADEIGLGPADAVAVLTHDVKFDEPAIVEALAPRLPVRGRGRVAEDPGAIVGRGCCEAGVTADDLARLRGPVGLDLGGRIPSETALAIMAEVVAERYGGSGTPMRRARPGREAGRGRWRRR